MVKRRNLFFRETIHADHTNTVVAIDRFVIVRTPLFALYVHRMHHPDGQRDPHDHPRHFISIVLRGGYTEEYYPTATDQRFDLRRHDRWSAHRKKIRVAHRIVAVDPGTITLCLLGRRRQDWGFYIRGGHVPPSEYLKQAGT
jgi:hypothetical protein